MGRYRGGHRYRSHRRKKYTAADKPSHQGMSETDSLLVEKYLIEYRSKAYGILNPSQSRNDEQFGEEARSYAIGSHVFPALTTELCKRPYIDLPETLTSKERRHIHALCRQLDLYHCGAGTNTGSHNSDESEQTQTIGKKRRIAVSIFANGLDHVPDLESPHKSNESFPSRKCRPWYNSACSVIKRDLKSMKSTEIEALKSTKLESSYENAYINRIFAIEEEKAQISQFVRYPEQSLRTPLRRSITESNETKSTSEQIDSINLGELESMDLSVVPTPKECPCMLVDTVEKLQECVDELMYGLDYTTTNVKQVPLLHELAFDLEMYNHTGGERKTALRTCLIQLTSNVAVKDYVIDPLAPGLWDAIPLHLGPLFSDLSIVKIGHGINGMDTTSLHRDFGIVVVNVFDTHEASAVLMNTRKGGLGLAALCKHYGLPSWKAFAELKENYQCSNWSKRPLDEQALEYGRFDVRCLIMLRKLLMRDLVKLDMIGGKNPFEYIKRKAWGESKSGVSSTRTSAVETSSASERSFTDSSFSYEGASNRDTFSEHDEFKDAVESTEDPIADEESEDEFVDAKEFNNNSTPAPMSQRSQILEALDLPAFHHLMQAIKISNKRCLKLWTGDDEEHISKHPGLLTMIQQSSTGRGYGRFWSDAHHTFYMTLAKWRESVAEREGIDAYEVCSLDFLLHVAYKQPLDRNEMRRFAYFLPEVLEDNSLPYYQELCQLIASSEVFDMRLQPPLSDMERFIIVFYDDQGRQLRNSKLKILAGTALFVSIASILLLRGTRRK